MVEHSLPKLLPRFVKVKEHAQAINLDCLLSLGAPQVAPAGQWIIKCQLGRIPRLDLSEFATIEFKTKEAAEAFYQSLVGP